MTIKTIPYRKPDLLLLVTIVVGVGFLVTSVAQAAEPNNFLVDNVRQDKVAGSEGWWQSVWGLELARKLRDWRPKISVQQKGAEGFKLAQPFGKTGPSLWCASSLPDSVRRNLRDSGDTRIGAFGNNSNAYLFLHKRW